MLNAPSRESRRQTVTSPLSRKAVTTGGGRTSGEGVREVQSAQVRRTRQAVQVVVVHGSAPRGGGGPAIRETGRKCKVELLDSHSKLITTCRLARDQRRESSLELIAKKPTA